MPEENQPVPENSSNPSVLDKNVPNPLAKNPNVHTHKVFATIGLILIGTIIVLAGLWWYMGNQTGSDTAETTTKTSTTSAKTATNSASKTDTSSWKTYTDSKSIFSIKYPDTWLTNNCDDNFFTSPTKETLGICSSEFGGMVGVFSIDEAYSEYINQGGFTDLSYLTDGQRKEVTVGGKQAIRISGTYKEIEAGPYKVGAQRIFYIVNSSGKVVFLNYYSESDWGDYSTTFEQMVQTFKFM